MEHTGWANETLKDAKLQWQVLTDRVNFNLTVDSGVVTDYDWYGVALKESSDKLSMIDGDYVVVMLKNQSLFHMNTFGYNSNRRPQNDTMPVIEELSVIKLSSEDLLVNWTRDLGTSVPSQTLKLVSESNYTLLYAYGAIENGVMQKHDNSNIGYGNITLSNTFSGEAEEDALNLYVGLVLSLTLILL